MVKSKLAYYITTFFLVLIIGCGADNKNKTAKDNDPASVLVDSLPRDTLKLKEASNEADLPVNEYLTEKLKPIRENFKRINSTTKWDSIETQELWETTEGGEAKFYYQNGQLEKIATRLFGETFQQFTEYYLLNGQLSFVFEKSYKYNRPMYYDSAAMKENNDTEAFDFGKAGIMEDRSYFANGQLLHRVNNQNRSSPFSEDYLLEEQKRIKNEFEKLISLKKKK